MAAPTANNFDLIRLLAAVQVVVHHATIHLGVDLHASPWFGVTGLFPGVPIFFFVSGFLISKSFERNSRLREYTPNRLLRIYPALIVCFVVALAGAAATGYFRSVDVPALALARWAAAQVTIGQFFNPEFMRGYGVGVLNGSLWTITVELQFYVLVPVLYALARAGGSRSGPSNRLLLVLLVIFVAINQLYVQLGGHAQAMWYKLLGVSFAPWFYMFLVGVLCQRNFAVCARWLSEKFFLVLLAYLALAWLAREVLGFSFGNSLNPLTFVALAALTFAAAYSYRSLSDRILRRNDISYGVYIYHMPVVNFLVAQGFYGTRAALAAALATTLILAFLSWRLVEKPALALKRHPLYQHFNPRAQLARKD